MKKILPYILLLISGIMHGQVVNIPDPAFKSKMVTSSIQNATALDADGNPIAVDSNGNGEIEVSEALAVYVLHLGNANIYSFAGINSFSNLEEIVADHNNVTSFDGTGLSNLKHLAIFWNELTSLNVNGLLNLERLWISNNELSTLNLANLPSLVQLQCQTNNLATLTLSGGFPMLEDISCQENELTQLILSDIPILYHLDCSSNNLISLNVDNVPSIEWLNVSSNPITTIDLSELLSLSIISLNATEVTEVDLSHQLFLYEINILLNPNLIFLNLKNGNIATHYALGNPNMQFICLDEGEETDVLESLEFFDFDITGIQINTYCSFNPGGDYNTISGSLNFSGNANCDSANLLSGFVAVNINDGTESGTVYNGNGNYSFYTQAGTFTITPQFENNWYTATPASATINLATVNNSTTTQDFCISPNGVHPDLEVVVVPMSAAQPGFDALYKLVYRNKGNQTLSGNVMLFYDDDYVDYVSASPAATTLATNEISWEYTNLLPFETRSVLATLNLNDPMETPSLEINDEIFISASISPSEGDATISDNTFDLNQVITGAFDPNDITCLQGNLEAPERIGEYLHYNINFENTGNAAATFVVVKDIIDAAQFDVGSLQLIETSHEVMVRRDGNKVEFIFDNIDLGPQEKGNVLFKIKTLNTLQVNDDVTQQAEIFFDYNWPIETNEATTVFQTLSRGNFAVDNSVTVSPNPAVSVIHVNANSTITMVQLYDIQGRLLQAFAGNDVSATIDVSNRAMGMYFLKVTTATGIKVEKLIKK